MPELPEVETVRAGLAPVMEGHVIARAETRREGLRWPFPPAMAERLSGARVLGLRRRAKYILGDLDTGETLLIHLGMSGRMLISGTTLGKFHHDHPAPEKHDHVVLHMADGARITFNDPRRFGAMDLMPTATAEAHPLLAALGPEPLGNAFSEGHLVAALAGRSMPVKSALLDQKIVAGLGNIYVCEALWRARLSPLRAAGTLATKAGGETVRSKRLAEAVRAVIGDAIAAGGSSLRDYMHADGTLGYFQHSFSVYDREGEACPAPGCRHAVQRIVQSGRSTFYCPGCQR